MYKFLRIFFTILSAIFAAAIIPAGIFLSLPYALASAAIAIIFFGVMLFFKSKQLDGEKSEDNEYEKK